MKKVFIGIAIVLVVAIVGTLGVSMIIYSPDYLFRVLKNGNSGVDDYKIFSSRTIQKSDSPLSYSHNPDESIGDIEVSAIISDEAVKTDLDSFLAQTGTTSFIVLRDDEVVFEEYYNGYSSTSVNTSFSAAKSMNSLLIGIAIDEGFIQSENQLIEEFIAELEGTQIGEITIKQLLMMRSPIKYEEGGLWFGDDAKTYYMPDLRDMAINDTKINPDYNGKFHYNNYHPLLLGIIIERSTGRSVAEYFEEKIWKKIGAGSDASWSLDSEETQFEKMESGINFMSIDFVKIGSMLINNGEFNGNRVVSEDWINRSILADYPLNEQEYEGSFLEGKDTGYKYMWYSTINENNEIDYYAYGKYSQILYVSPANGIVILRTGTESGGIDWWPYILKEIVGEVASANGG